MNLTNLSIFSMTINDLNQIQNILETEFDNFWNYNVFKSEIENPKSNYFVCKIDKKIVGFIGVLIVLDEADITNIVVRKNFRNMRNIKCTYEIYN